MNKTRTSFHNKEGDALSGTLYKPESVHKHPAVIVAHHSQGGVRDCDIYQGLAEALTEIGIAVLVFDRRGQGQSAGNFDEASFEDLTSDLLFAKEALQSRQDIGQIGLWGMSQGGWLAPFAASRSEDIAFLILVSSATTTPAEQMIYSATFALKDNGFTSADIDEMHALRKLYDDYYRSGIDRVPVQKKLEEAKLRAWFPFAYMGSHLPTDVEKTKWHKTLDFDPATYMANVKVPVLLVYGEVDPWVPVSESISQWRKSKVTNLTVEQVRNANHFMLTISGSGIYGDTGTVCNQYQQVMVNWLKKHVLQD